MQAKVGIELIDFYVPNYFLDMADLAFAKNVLKEKYYTGLGQEKMSVLPSNEDIVTMGASAAKDIIAKIDHTKIDLLIFATESGIDQSKAAGIYVHSLLGLNPSCRVIEVKQACYSSTAALRLGVSYIKDHLDSKVLIIASDVAKYGINTVGEPTQGCGAVAMIVSADPKIIAFDDYAGFVTKDVMDFWRPNYMEEALVDGHYSTKLYLTTLIDTWVQYKALAKRGFRDHARFCYHLPFSKMAEKAHTKLTQYELGEASKFDWEDILDTLHYSKIIGNCYTASLYLGFISLLDNLADLTKKRIAFFAYGSGCVAEFFSGVISHNYLDYIFTQKHHDMLSQRKQIDYQTYKELYTFQCPQDGSVLYLSQESTSPFILSKIAQHKRYYEKTSM